MNSPANGTPLHQPALDWLFARLGGNPDPENAPGTEDRCDDPPTTEEVGPPPINSPEDLRIAAEWVQRERQRLEAYTRTQLARIHQEHQTLLQQNYYYEQGLILRSQEVARKEEMLLAQGRAIDQQVHDLARREQDLVGQLQNWWQANEELAALREVTQTAQQDSATQRALLQALQTETAALQSARESARTELQGLIAATEDMRQTRGKEEAAMKARQTQLEQRLLAAERAILAADQRQAELDYLSSRLQHESEQQERDREQRQRVLDALEDRLRTELAGLDASRAQLDRRPSRVQPGKQSLSPVAQSSGP